jgi:hypothetical protein
MFLYRVKRYQGSGILRLMQRMRLVIKVLFAHLKVQWIFFIRCILVTTIIIYYTDVAESSSGTTAAPPIINHLKRSYSFDEKHNSKKFRTTSGSYSTNYFPLYTTEVVVMPSARDPNAIAKFCWHVHIPSTGDVNIIGSRSSKAMFHSATSPLQNEMKSPPGKLLTRS